MLTDAYKRLVTTLHDRAIKSGAIGWGRYVPQKNESETLRVKQSFPSLIKHLNNVQKADERIRKEMDK